MEVQREIENKIETVEDKPMKPLSKKTRLSLKEMENLVSEAEEEYEFYFRCYASWKFPKFSREQVEVWVEMKLNNCYQQAMTLVMGEMFLAIPKKAILNTYPERLAEAHRNKLEDEAEFLRKETGMVARKEGLSNDV